MSSTSSPSAAPLRAWRGTGREPVAAIVAAVVVAVVAMLSVGPAGGQDSTTTVPPAELSVPTTVADGGAATVPDTETPTVVEAEPQEDRFLTSESRRIVAAIGGLVVVALGILLLTVRYWRQTKPVPPSAAGDRVVEEPVVDEPVGGVAAGVGRPSRRAVAGADHAAVDEGWEPLATGEHARVDLPNPGLRPRPGVEARRKVLGRT